MFSILTGLIGGMMHVFTGPDHLSAIMPLSAKVKKSTWIIGLRWGVGHTGGVLLIGLLVLLLRGVIPLKFISSLSERIVGLTLIAIGIWGLEKVLSDPKRKIQSEKREPNTSEKRNNKVFATPYAAAFFVGIIHGLAGSSHLVGILPALVMRKKSDAALYMLSFGIGTITAMTSFSSLIGYISNRLSLASKDIYKGLLSAFSLTSMIIGSIWLTV